MRTSWRGTATTNVRTDRLRFAGGTLSTAAWVQEPADLRHAVAELGLNGPRPALVVVGGASDLEQQDGAPGLRELFGIGVAGAVEAAGAVAIDGGTNTGVMRALGRARAQPGRSFPLIGVVPAGVVSLPGDGADGGVRLEPNHTHFLIVPGEEWGAAVPWLDLLATVVAGDLPTLTVLVNGGDVSFEDVAASVSGGRRVLVVDGTGRTADLLAEAVRTGSGGGRAGRLAGSGLIDVFEAGGDGEALAATILAVLSQSEEDGHG
jgi:hypothetical protein